MAQVLLVEDEPLVSDVVQDALEDEGFSVTTARTDIEAYARLHEEGRSFAALVTDVNLGCSTTGFEIAARARQLNPAIRVVYMTGLASNIYAAEVEALMFPKPFDAIELARQLKSLADD
jgi:Response regulator containing CheY-like receiver, AAA-type ATPase, and DNA-binding domains